MSEQRIRPEPVPKLVFGERYARNAAIGAACLGLLVLLSVIADSQPFPLLAVSSVVLLSHWFRRRTLADEQRHRGTLEDERDLHMLARGDRVFRTAASGWAVVLALALVLPDSRAMLLVFDLRLPSVLVLGVIVANLAGHLAVARAYARERS